MLLGCGGTKWQLRGWAVKVYCGGVEIGGWKLEVGTMAFGNCVVKDVGAELVPNGECAWVWDRECMVNGGCETCGMRID